MSTTTMPDSARRYLDEVSSGLADVLPAEEAEEVLQDLEAHLAEIGEDDIESILGSPAEFLAEFRSSAGLDDTDVGTTGWVGRLGDRGTDTWHRLGEWFSKVSGPLLAPLAQHRQEIRTAWIWSRGILFLLAYAWSTGADLYGEKSLLVPHGSALPVQLLVVAAATFISVRLGSMTGGWWKRMDTVVSLGVGFLMLVAVTTTSYVTYPEEQAYYLGDGVYFEDGTPAPLIGSNGPIRNIYAYDTAGNPVQVFLYDDHGNPIQTVPNYIYEDATGAPYALDEYGVRLQIDEYGRPIGNLYPLEQYDWTETGARSAPQPPPVVGIPALPGDVTITTTTTTAGG